MSIGAILINFCETKRLAGFMQLYPLAMGESCQPIGCGV
jgi:hypothetical protein